ncbi:hypothetical protein ACFVWL_10355 [Microbacterium sp. NPDC058269]|uniref:hypothetical protein n=1 Tax=Microbacterium sp. NPDC058269 TaxID=3346414 RepID=UPI0036DBB4E7
MKLSEYVTQVINDPKYGHDIEWVKGNLARTHIEAIEAASDAEVLREAATELEYGIRLDAYPDADVVPVASEQRARAHATVGGVTAMQRTIRAGEWVPVKQEGAEQ